MYYYKISLIPSMWYNNFISSLYLCALGAFEINTTCPPSGRRVYFQGGNSNIIELKKRLTTLQGIIPDRKEVKK
jgi:hypothetical protein